MTGDDLITAVLSSKHHRFLPEPAVCGEHSSCVPLKGGHPLLQRVTGDGGASGLKGKLSVSLLMNLTCVTAATEKNKEEKREQLKKFLDLVFLSEEQR